jgi:anthranilate phosphoribosyltransferase
MSNRPDEPFSWRGVLAPLLRGEDLREDDARAAMGEILAGEATSAQIAALATGLRIKGETAEELTGLVKAMLDAAGKLEVAGPLIDTCGTGGAGTFNASTLAAIVVAGAGGRVAKHGNRAASGRCGSADLLEALGVVITLPPAGVRATIEATGIGFCFAPVFHPAMRHAIPTRRELGVPTVFNFLGPLTNPARAGHQAMGVVDPAMAPKMAEVLRRTGIRHAWVFTGGDGLDELTTTTSSRVLDVRPDGITEHTVDPAGLGIAPPAREQLLGGDVEHNVAITRALLGGEEGPLRDLVLLNAAAALVAGDLAPDLEAGMQLAATAVDSGRAAAALDAWAESSRTVAKDLA